MRRVIFFIALAWCLGSAATESVPDPLERLKALAGEWQADLPGYGTLSNSIRLVSNGKAVEETIGSTADNEVSLYTRDQGRVLLSHFCAMTPDGHVVRLETPPVHATGSRFEFEFVTAANLHSEAAPHMRRVTITFVDRDHFN